MDGNHHPDWVEFPWNEVLFIFFKLRYVSVVDDAALQADLSGALSTLLEAWCIMIRTIYSDLRLPQRRWWLIFIDWKLSRHRDCLKRIEKIQDLKSKDFHKGELLWMVAKSCTTLDGWNLNGINMDKFSTGAEFRWPIHSMMMIPGCFNVVETCWYLTSRY